MGFRSVLSKPFAAYVARETRRWSYSPVESQEKVLAEIVQRASYTAFGKGHNFDQVKNYNDFKSNVPIRDYEELKPWIDRLVKGESDVLLQGLPEYFSKTSGTTSGVKFIPVT